MGILPGGVTEKKWKKGVPTGNAMEHALFLLLRGNCKRVAESGTTVKMTEPWGTYDHYIFSSSLKVGTSVPLKPTLTLEY